MLKTDKDSLEKISFKLDDRDLANFRFILERLKSEELLSMPAREYKRIINGLNEIAKLKLDGKIYAFHVHDTFTDYPDDEGVELYLRQGNILKPYLQSGDRTDVPSIDDAVDYLNQNNRIQIYTGPIITDSDFLGLKHIRDKEDPIYTNALTAEDIIEFKSNGIEVVSLDYLM
jgi:hypothetical protein